MTDASSLPQQLAPAASESHAADSGLVEGLAEALTSEVRDLERRSYDTYRARMVAAQRLDARQSAWSASLLAVTTSAVIASIAVLVNSNLYGLFGGMLLAALSVITLVVSLATTGLNYSGRARDMFINYRKMQRLSVEAENLLRLPQGLLRQSSVTDLQMRYQALLDESENHTRADYEASRLATRTAYLASDAGVKWVLRRCQLLTLLPYALLLFPLALLVPVLVAGFAGLV